MFYIYFGMMSYPLDQSESHSAPLSWSELFGHFDGRKAPNYEEPVVHVQWNLSNPDTLRTEESVLISEVS